jgi:ABC-type dipeptide/oligopeptide/nickel transport system ATPase component
METIYFTLQGKGGVGKTLSSSYLMQYLNENNNIKDKKRKIKGIDTDPNNRSFKSIKKLDIEELPLFNENQQINERNFDKMIETFFNNQDTTFVVDNGATSFLPLISYLVENDIMQMLEEKFHIVINIPITGGEAQNDTLNGMKYIIDTFKEDNVNFNIWINEFFGKVIKDEKPFEQMEYYEKYKSNIHGIFTLPQVNANTYGVDLRKMHKAKQTFEEVAKDTEYKLMEKQRLIGYKNKLFDSLELIIKQS